ncbi:hypothetical protein LCGC14_1034190 [marine sediment metagenome]|uniref:Uncharacterized protein n=1 Tax=marine sediment metagenome TaxID=412755 RepID=A0A0F9QBU8_9ZZZZ
MTPIKQKFKILFKKKFKDMSDVLFSNFKAGILINNNNATFIEEEIDGLIELYTYSYKENRDLPKFKKAYQEKVDVLTNHVFYALDKGIEGNKLKIELLEGNITCHFTVKTAVHKEQNLFFIENENDEKEKSDNAKHMTI